MRKHDVSEKVLYTRAKTHSELCIFHARSFGATLTMSIYIYIRTQYGNVARIYIRKLCFVARDEGKTRENVYVRIYTHISSAYMVYIVLCRATREDYPIVYQAIREVYTRGEAQFAKGLRCARVRVFAQWGKLARRKGTLVPLNNTAETRHCRNCSIIRIYCLFRLLEYIISYMMPAQNCVQGIEGFSQMEGD